MTGQNCVTHQALYTIERLLYFALLLG
ncbi:hypothetical protein KGM_211582A, partial [Danaus plexippus plexippus]